MAYLRFSHAPQHAHLTLGFPSPPQFQFLSIQPLNFSPISSTFRGKGSTRLQVNQRLLTVFASNPNSGGGKSPEEGSSVDETSNATQGPPLLTILAGFFVLFVIGWSIWSIIKWLITLIVNAPLPK